MPEQELVIEQTSAPLSLLCNVSPTPLSRQSEETSNTSTEDTSDTETADPSLDDIAWLNLIESSQTTTVAEIMPVDDLIPADSFDKTQLYTKADGFDDSYPEDLPPLPPPPMPGADIPTLEQWKNMTTGQAVSQVKAYFEVIRSAPSLQSGQHLSKEDADAACSYFDAYASRLKESHETLTEKQYNELVSILDDAKQELQVAADPATDITQVPTRIQNAELCLKTAEICVRDSDR